MLEACITNLGKYNEGELDDARVTFPTDSETLAQAFTDIGMDFKHYEEFFISDIECSSVAGIHHFVGEYTNLDELNYFAEKLAELNPNDHDFMAAVLVLTCVDTIKGRFRFRFDFFYSLWVQFSAALLRNLIAVIRRCRM